MTTLPNNWALGIKYSFEYEPPKVVVEVSSRVLSPQINESSRPAIPKEDSSLAKPSIWTGVSRRTCCSSVVMNTCRCK